MGVRLSSHQLARLATALDIAIVGLLSVLAPLFWRHADPLPTALLVLLCLASLARAMLTHLTLRRLEWQAHHDPVTGLPNRRLFYHRTGPMLQGRRQTAILLLQIDRFRLFLGNLGHSACDRLLRAVANRLAAAVPEKNACLYQLETDTFALVLHEGATATQTARRLIEALHRPVHVDHREFWLSVSIGISCYPADGQTLPALIRAAELALRQAQRRGGGTCCRYRPQLEPALGQPLALEGYLRHAVEYDELELYFQPQVRLDDGGLLGAEITLRWHHPQHGLLPPERFIPLAEETGLIGPITQWLLEQALCQLERWRESEFARLRLAINISAYQFHQQRLPELLQAALKRHPVDPGKLELEITETAAMFDVDHTIRILRQLKDLGIRLALDDFGTGYSSLNHLRRFPLDTLKIDQSFVRPMPEDAGSKAIVHGIIQLGHSLGLTTLAEGIETRSQWESLRRFGCDEGQGYLFGRPLPLAQFEARYRQARDTVKPRTPAP
ncbi:hypothetical protein MIT9_P1681 [Methylomarinovum caldicuralii]|uniref:cyclic-guanylate-specific phosphodiesterase n=1 Tax=Methylomarinovum caldicuralii TaxID=438856 RepID=A0AAU9C193_9GAMM|nr:bifunctional diguanylate cyclase/phosphodiesterase [Methylomarinovum caldicuralii]BCX82097.1 hypothetical protein MIT9_P1681 [Methylomarinovum caldicuralii]